MLNYIEYLQKEIFIDMSDIMLEALRELRNQNEKIDEGKMLDRVKEHALNADVKEDTEDDEELKEDLQNILDHHDIDLPATPLPKQDILDFVDALPAPADHVPPVFFKLGYMRELPVASKFAGKRGWRPGMPIINILKCTEYSSLYTGTDWKGTKDTREVDKLLGTDRHTGERTGFSHDETNKIGYYGGDTSKPFLQAYIAHNSRQKVKYFISTNGDDFVEASREDIAQYLTLGEADKLLNPQVKDRGFDAQTGIVGTDTPINRLDVKGIYMIGKLGHSIM